MSAESFTLGFQKQNRNRIFERLHVVKYSLVRGCWFLPADVLLRGTRGCQSRVGASSEASAGGSLGCQRYWHHCHWEAMNNLPQEREQSVTEYTCVTWFGWAGVILLLARVWDGALWEEMKWWHAARRVCQTTYWSCAGCEVCVERQVAGWGDWTGWAGMKHRGTGRGWAAGLLTVNSWASAASQEESGCKNKDAGFHVKHSCIMEPLPIHTWTTGT